MPSDAPLPRASSARPAPTATVVPPTPVAERPAPDVAALVADAEAYIVRARAANTTRAYRADWADFRAWCAEHAAEPLPADPRVVALYLTARAPTLKTATLARRLAAIAHHHRAGGHTLDVRDPTLRDTWRGIRRTHGTAQTRKVPTVTELLRALLDTLPDTLLGTRDRALLLVGFAGCFRRAELVALDHADVGLHADGLVLQLRRSKTDPEARGTEVGIPYGTRLATCPVRALQAWVQAAGIAEGALFRPVNRHGQVLPRRLTDHSVARVVKRTVAAARRAALGAENYALAELLDPRRFAGHSLRAGFITSAAAAGVSETDIMRQSRHLRGDTLRKYVRHATVFRQNAAARVGL
jgi:site-specific recombinase XerD